MLKEIQWDHHCQSAHQCSHHRIHQTLSKIDIVDNVEWRHNILCQIFWTQNYVMQDQSTD